MSKTLKGYLSWVEDHAARASRGDAEALAALKVFSVVASGKARLAARQAIAEVEAEAAEPFTFAVDRAEAPAAEPFEFSV